MLKENRLIPRLRSQFSLEWMWRLFVVLQFVELLGIIYLDLSGPRYGSDSWSILPDFYSRGRFDDWDLLNGRFWTRYQTNWYLITFLFGSFVVAKATDWIAQAHK